MHIQVHVIKRTVNGGFVCLDGRGETTAAEVVAGGVRITCLLGACECDE
jgi:hypothetical protein